MDTQLARRLRANTLELFLYEQVISCILRQCRLESRIGTTNNDGYEPREAFPMSEVTNNRQLPADALSAGWLLCTWGNELVPWTTLKDV